MTVTGDSHHAGPLVKGWCPGAYRPMMSGDGLVVRVRPPKARLTTDQALGLCALAQRFGNGIIDLTSRANLQIRGVELADHDPLLQELVSLGLLDRDPVLEERRNILVTPVWQPGDVTDRLYDRLAGALVELPELPAKMGFAVDTGAGPVLGQASADLRLELSASAGLILRANGAASGMPVSEDTVPDAVADMLDWFCATGGRTSGRMDRHLVTASLPDRFTGHMPAAVGPRIAPGGTPGGQVLGVPFGALEAGTIADMLRDTGATALRTTPWRLLVLEHARPVSHKAFVSDPQDPRLRVHACPGAPRCSQALQDTRTLAQRLAPEIPPHMVLHVSGCAKGCAFPRAANLTLVGTGSGFDLVRQGSAWEEPARTALNVADITKELTA